MANAILFLVLGIIIFILAGLAYESESILGILSTFKNQVGITEQEATSQSAYEFDVSDMSASTNGNGFVAMHKMLQLTPKQIWQNAREMSLAQITKHPYLSIGKLYKLTGRVYKVEDYLPSPKVAGKWAEIRILVENENGGATSVFFIYNGDINELNPNTDITCAGFFVGTDEGHNAMGGPVVAYVIVGNSFKTKYPEREFPREQ